MGRRKRAEDRGLLKRGGIWHVRTDPIEGRQMSTGCRTLEGARKWREQREIAAANPAYAAAQAATVAEWCQRLIDEKRETRSLGTVHYTTKKLGHWLRLYGDALLSEVTPGLVDVYVSKRRAEEVTDRTISKEITTLQEMLAMAKRAGCYPSDIKTLRPQRLDDTYRPVERWLQGPEVTRLLTAMEPHRGAFVALCVGLGVRRSEALSMVPSQIDLEKWQAFIRGTKTEGARRWVPILSPFRALVAEAYKYLPLEPWPNLSRDLNAACRRAGVPRVTPNDLRRSQATMLAEAGVEPDIIRRLLGHTTTRLVEQVYARPRAAVIGEQAERKLAALPAVEVRQLRDSDAHANRVSEEPPRELESRTYGLRSHKSYSVSDSNSCKTSGNRAQRDGDRAASDAEDWASVAGNATGSRQFRRAEMGHHVARRRAALGFAANAMGVLS